MTTTNHPDPEASRESPKPAGGDAAPRWTILLVDDEPDILLSIKLLVERSKKGVKVVTASSGAEGLEILADTHVDLLISDFKMPGMDGIEFLAKSRELWPGLPRIMFTAYADMELARRAFTEAFVIDFLPKTLGPSQLVAKVESLLVEHVGLDGGASVSGEDSADPSEGAAGVAS